MRFKLYGALRKLSFYNLLADYNIKLSDSHYGVGFITTDDDGNWTIAGDGWIKSNISSRINLLSSCESMEVDDNSMVMMGYSGWDNEFKSSSMFAVEREAAEGFRLSVSTSII